MTVRTRSTGRTAPRLRPGAALGVRRAGGVFARWVFAQVRHSCRRPDAGASAQGAVFVYAPRSSHRRILGFDNARGVKPLGRSKRRPLTYDHWHRDATDRGRPYAFTDAATLLRDFYTEAERLLCSGALCSTSSESAPARRPRCPKQFPGCTRRADDGWSGDELEDRIEIRRCGGGKRRRPDVGGVRRGVRGLMTPPPPRRGRA